MASGGWEVVGASRKKKLPKQNSLEKQVVAEDNGKNKGSHRIEKHGANSSEITRPLEQFKLNKKVAEDNDEFFVKTVHTQAAPSKTSKKKSTVTSKPKTLKDSITKLNLTELQNLLKLLRSKFSKEPLVWLKDMASFLNVRLNPATPVDSAYRQESVAAPPVDYLTQPVREFFARLLQSCNTDVLSQFHRHCFTSMLDEAMRGLAVHGYAIFIQVMSSVCPAAAISHYEYYSSLRQKYDNHPRPGLTFVWLVTQVINSASAAKRQHVAVTLWMEGLLPLIESKQYSVLASQSGRDMAIKLDTSAGKSVHRGLKSSDRKDEKAVVSSKQLIHLLDLIFASPLQLPRNVSKQLTETFNRLKLACSKDSEEAAAALQSLLPRLTSSCAPALAHQIESFCTMALQNSSSQCWAVWQKIAPKHWNQTIKLLQFIGNDDSSKVLASPESKQALEYFEQLCAKSKHESVIQELIRELQKVRVTEKTEQQRHDHLRRTGRCSGWSYRTGLLILLFCALGWFSNHLLVDFDNTFVAKLSARVGLLEWTRSVVQVSAHTATFIKRVLSNYLTSAGGLLKSYHWALYEKALGASDWIKGGYPELWSAMCAALTRVSEAYQVLWRVLHSQLEALAVTFRSSTFEDAVNVIMAKLYNVTAHILGSSVERNQ